MNAQIRTFETGATRDLDAEKLDYEGFLSPLVLRRFAQYMHRNRRLADGSMRAGDNWQRGIPKEAYAKSGWRHFMDWWMEHRGHATEEGVEEACCALMFNVMGYLHEHLKAGAPAPYTEHPLSPAAERAIAAAEDEDDAKGEPILLHVSQSDEE